MWKNHVNESEFNFHLDQNVVIQWTHSIREKLDNQLGNGFKSSLFGRIQSSLYALEDSQLVIDDYKKLDNFKAIDSGYLKLYGLLQALFVQQDSLKNLRLVISDLRTDLQVDFKNLYKIRQIRNMTVGHPTDKNGEYFLISRATLNKYGYQLIGYRKSNETEIINVNLYELLINQDLEITQFMEEIEKKLE